MGVSKAFTGVFPSGQVEFEKTEYRIPENLKHQPNDIPDIDVPEYHNLDARTMIPTHRSFLCFDFRLLPITN